MEKKQIIQETESAFCRCKKAITYTDYERIMNLITEDVGKAHILPESLHKLYLIANNSKKYDSRKMPQNVVTLNSEVIIANDDNQKQLIRIVLPHNISGKHDISVYSLLGIACLGAKERDYVDVDYKNAKQKLFVEKIIFQPEKEKHYNL